MADINTNFDTLNTDKIEYSDTAPAIGDLVVAAATDWSSIKKKVFTASQVLESDSNGQPTSAAKATWYNKALGTTAGTVLEWSNDALYAKLAGTQTIAGVKTFSSSPIIPTASNSSNDTTAASTAFVKNVIPTMNNQKFQAYAISAIPTSFSVAHGLSAAPSYVKVKTYCDRAWWSSFGAILQICEWTYKSAAYSTWYITTASANPPTFAAIATTTSTISQLSYDNSWSGDDATFTMTISSIDSTNINFAITRTLGTPVGNILFAIEFVI